MSFQPSPSTSTMATPRVKVSSSVSVVKERPPSFQRIVLFAVHAGEDQVQVAVVVQVVGRYARAVGDVGADLPQAHAGGEVEVVGHKGSAQDAGGCSSALVTLTGTVGPGSSLAVAQACQGTCRSQQAKTTIRPISQNIRNMRKDVYAQIWCTLVRAQRNIDPPMNGKRSTLRAAFAPRLKFFSRQETSGLPAVCVARAPAFRHATPSVLSRRRVLRLCPLRPSSLPGVTLPFEYLQSAALVHFFFLPLSATSRLSENRFYLAPSPVAALQ